MQRHCSRNFPVFLALGRRQVAPPCSPGYRRYNSKMATNPLLKTHLFRGIAWGAGVGIGAVAIVAGFAYISGWKDKIDTVHKTLEIVNRASTVFGEGNEQPNPNELLKHVQKAVKLYLSGVPFAEPLVDLAFNSIGSAIEAHQEEATVIILKMAGELQETIDRHKVWSVATAQEILAIVHQETAKLQELSNQPESQLEVIKETAANVAKDGLQTVQTWGRNIERLVTGKKNETPADDDSKEP